jgi:hypothetical protein
MLQRKSRREPRGRAIARMLRWIERSGGYVGRLRIIREEGAWRVRAAEDIAAGQAIIEIPLRALLTVETAKASAIGRAVAATGMQLSNSGWLALSLLEELRPAPSFWRPYVAALPRRMPGIPLFFTERELALLEGSAAGDLARARRQSLEQEYATLCEHIGGIDTFSLDEFLTAHAIVGSRSFSIEVFGVRTVALVPLADLIDHSLSPGTAWLFDDMRGAFVLGATEPIARGAAVHDCYGTKGNGDLLVQYGFCLEGNDTVLLRFDDDSAFVVTADPEGEGTRAMLAFVRERDPSLRLLADACAQALARFPTTIAEDDALLALDGLTRNARNAIVVRRGEKRVLAWLAALALAG